jgi:hypothetical protein
VGIVPADQPITLDENGALVVDPLGANRDVIAHVVLIDNRGAAGIASVHFPRQEEVDSSSPASTDNTQTSDSSDTNTSGSTSSSMNNGFNSVVRRLFGSIDATSATSFFLLHHVIYLCKSFLVLSLPLHL